MLSEDRVEITLNDQRRLFSDAYENLILAARPALIEVSAHSPIAQMEAVAPAELKNFPCILIAPPPEREAEQEFSRIVLGFPSEFLYAENWEEARLLRGQQGISSAGGRRKAGSRTAHPCAARAKPCAASSHILRVLEKGEREPLRAGIRTAAERTIRCLTMQGRRNRRLRLFSYQFFL